MNKTRSLTSFEMTINYLYFCEGVGWRLRRQPTPSQPNSAQITVIQSVAKNPMFFFTGQQ